MYFGFLEIIKRGQEMGRFKLFIENFVVYGLGSIISKIVPFVMLPIVTRLMPDTFYFGLNDMSTIIISFGSSLAIMGMYDAMFRLFFDKDDKEYKQEICSSALGFTCCTSIILFVILLIFRRNITLIFFGSEKYLNLLMLSAISILIGATNTIVSAPTRMQNQRKIYLVTNVLSPIISYSISIPLLKKGLFVIALPISGVISAFAIEFIFIILNRKWFSYKKIKKEHIFNMLKIALPLLPNFLIYWIFNSCDRLMITNMLGAEFTGIYSIGVKIGQISQLIYTAFASGWQYFAFSTMNDQDQVKLTSNIFEYLGIITFSAGMFMAALSKGIFQLLFEGDYILGYIVAPYLFLAPLLLMLYQIACNQFLVIKKTWPNLFILSGGAIINIGLNYILIPKINIEGAGIATLLGYIFSVVICVIVLTKMKLLDLSIKFCVYSILAMLYFLFWRFVSYDNILSSCFIAIIITGIFIVGYWSDIKKVVHIKNDKKQ